jgi:tetratricopeptide (TPR) repeat protein
MTEITDRITPEMSEEEVLGVILDEIMARAEPDVAEAIRFCAIPHWFNEEIIAWLRGEGFKPSRRSREILAALTELTFVGPDYERGWAYHENVRDLLLRRWRERDSQEFKELSGQAAGYFGQIAEAATDEDGDMLKREQMYHLLAADSEQGFDLFGSMFNKARNFYQLSTCTLLLQLAGEQEAYLSAEDRLWLRFRQGQLAYHSTQWPEALKIYEGLWREDLPLSLEGALANDLGLLYKDEGEWERAIEYYERSLAIKEKVGDEQERAITFNNLGTAHKARGEWKTAIECYERSLAIAQKIGDEKLLSAIFNNLGEVHRIRGGWEVATKYYEKGLALCEKVGDEHGMAIIFNNLGLVYQARGEWEQAIEYHEKGLAIDERVGDEHGMAISYNNIARPYQEQERLEEAIPLFEKSLEIFERIGDKPNADIARGNLEKAKRELELHRQNLHKLRERQARYDPLPLNTVLAIMVTLSILVAVFILNRDELASLNFLVFGVIFAATTVLLLFILWMVLRRKKERRQGSEHHDHLKRLLELERKNLWRLEERKARYGPNPPLELLSEIDMVRTEILRIEKELEAKKGQG